MSGICGILRFDGRPVSKASVERQMKALAHLGPDRSRLLCDGPVGLGQLLMRVTQEDAFDAQPLHHAGSLVTLCADIRLDNRDELGEALSIEKSLLRDLPDSALLLHAYSRWNENLVDHLIGDFAFAIWDGRARKLVLGRDHIGQRHVFYHRGQDFFAWATEIKGLWALPDVPREMSDQQVARLLLHDWTGGPGRTPFEGIVGLPGGTVMTLTADGVVTSRRYWEPHADPAHEGRDEAYYVEAYRRVLSEAVACRLRRTTRPAGLFLAGGFDSSAIAALAGPTVRAQGRKLITVSSVMPDGYRGTIRHARRWVDLCCRDMPHLDVRYVTREGRNIFTAMEERFLMGDWPHSPNGYVTAEMYGVIAAAGARVVMDGHGGDYTLHPRGQRALVWLLLTGQLRRFCAEFGPWRRHRNRSVWQTIQRDIILMMLPAKLATAWRKYRAGLNPFGPAVPVTRDFARTATDEAASSGRPYSFFPADMRRSMERTLRDMQDLVATAGSIPAAAYGLEFTQPYHDKRVVELALAIPEDLYVRNGRPRHLARTALKELYPPEFQTRPPGNDDLIPDFLSMAKSIEAEVLAEIDRMERSGKLSGKIDFAKMRRMLTARSAERHSSGSEFDTRHAMLTFLDARYIEWFRGDNR